MANAYGGSVDELTDGGFILSAANLDTIYYDPLDSAIFGIIEVVSILKTDSMGEVDWVKNYETGAACAYGGGFTKTYDNGMSYATVITDSFSYNTDVLLFKANTLGNIVWAKKIGGFGNEYPIQMFEGPDHSLWVGSYSDTHIEDNGDIYIIRSTENGNILWGKTYDFKKGYEFPTAMHSNPIDSGAVISGITMSAQPSTMNYLTILRLNKNGEIIFHRRYYCPLDTNGYIYPNRIKCDKQGNLILTGDINLDNKSGIFVLKTNPMGNAIWFKIFEVNNNAGSVSGWDILLDEMNNHYLILSSWYEMSNSLGVLRIDQHGNFITFKTLSGNFTCWPNSFKYTSNNNLIITGIDITNNYGTFLLKTTASLSQVCSYDEKIMNATNYTLAFHTDTSFKVLSNNWPATVAVKEVDIEQHDICKLELHCDENFKIPNVFSPNNDLINDSYMLNIYQEEMEFSFSIYNRWGTLIAELNKNNLIWDGKTITGSEVNEGVMFYVFKSKCGDKEIIKKGTISIFK